MIKIKCKKCGKSIDFLKNQKVLDAEKKLIIQKKEIGYYKLQKQLNDLKKQYEQKPDKKIKKQIDKQHDAIRKLNEILKPDRQYVTEIKLQNPAVMNPMSWTHKYQIKNDKQINEDFLHCPNCNHLLIHDVSGRQLGE